MSGLRQRGAEQVAVLVDRVAGDCGEDEVGHELPPQVLDVDLRGADRLGPAGLAVEILALADVNDDGHDIETALLQRAQDHGGVETAAIGEYGLLLRNDTLARHG